MLPLIFKTESILNPLPLFFPFLSAFMFYFAPKCSQVRARRKFAGAAAVPTEATQGRDAGGTVAFSPRGRPRLWVLRGLARGLARAVGSPPSLPAPPATPRLTYAAPPPLRASGVASRPSSHTLSIRCVYFFPDSRHIWSTYSGYSSATRHIPQDHFSGCYGDLPPSSDFQVA